MKELEKAKKEEMMEKIRAASMPDREKLQRWTREPLVPLVAGTKNSSSPHGSTGPGDDDQRILVQSPRGPSYFGMQTLRQTQGNSRTSAIQVPNPRIHRISSCVLYLLVRAMAEKMKLKVPENPRSPRGGVRLQRMRRWSCW